MPRLQKNLPSDVKLGVIVDTSENILNTYRQFDGDGDVRPAVRRDCGIPVPGTLAGYIDYLYYDSLSLIASFIYLAISGNTINIISLSSLSIAMGMVVDDTIVVLENVTTHIERGSDPKQAAVRNERGGYFRSGFYADDDCRILPADHGNRYVRRAVQAVGLDDVRHYVCIHRFGFDADADALFTNCSACSVNSPRCSGYSSDR